MSTGPTPIGVVARFNLLERLEPSGPGDLYRARDTQHGRTVVVRLLPSEFAVDPAERARLLAQAEAMVVLSHPNVTALFEAGEHEGRVYLVFEFLRGQSLRGEMGGRAMNVRRAVELAVQIADGVAEAHAAGYVHGGLSPDSIVITAKGHAKIPAFPLATRDGFEPASSGSAAIRLRDYDAPEEAAGRGADDRSDIYTVAAILFEMLTARRPLHRGAAAPSATNRHVPAELDAVVLKALAPNPESRYQSIATFAAELRSIGAILDVRGGAGDEDEGDIAPAGGGSRVLLVALLIVLAAAGVVWWITRG